MEIVPLADNFLIFLRWSEMGMRKNIVVNYFMLELQIYVIIIHRCYFIIVTVIIIVMNLYIYL